MDLYILTDFNSKSPSDHEGDSGIIYIIARFTFRCILLILRADIILFRWAILYAAIPAPKTIIDVINLFIRLTSYLNCQALARAAALLIYRV